MTESKIEGVPHDNFGTLLLSDLAMVIDPAAGWWETASSQVFDSGRDKVELLDATVRLGPYTVVLMLKVRTPGGQVQVAAITDRRRSVSREAEQEIEGWRDAPDPGFRLFGGLSLIVDPLARFEIHSWNEVHLEEPVELFHLTTEVGGRTIDLRMEFHDQDYYAGLFRALSAP